MRADEPRLAFQRRDEGRHRVAARLDAVGAGLDQRDCAMRRLDLDGMIRIAARDAEVDRALVELQLGDGGVQPQHVELGRVVHSRHRRSDLDLVARAGLGPEGLARGDRVIHPGIGPLRLACAVERDGPLDVAQPPRQRRRIGRLGAAGPQGGENGNKSGHARMGETIRHMMSALLWSR